MNPIIILETGLMKAEDMKLLRDNGICVVECKDPAKVKFVDPIPSAAQRGKIESAAISLSRILLNGQWGQYQPSSRSDFARLFFDCLSNGTDLDPRGSMAEQQQQTYNYAYTEETQRLARADAKAAREALKAKSKSEEAKVPKASA